MGVRSANLPKLNMTFQPNFGLKPLGVGVGLRHPHMEQIAATSPPCEWFEIIAEAFMYVGGRDAELLEQIGKSYPLIAHGVGLSLGSTDPIDFDYLKGIKALLDRINSPWYSDHLCFTMVDHVNINELVPLPFTSEAIENCANRIRTIQDFLERPFLVENITRYMTVSDSEMSEVEFINGVLESADCGLLLDIANVCLNAKIHDFDPLTFIKALPLHRVGQVHLAGWEERLDGEVADSHDAPVPPEVLAVFGQTIRLIGATSVVVEWDREIPPLDRLLMEAGRVEESMRGALEERDAI